MKILCEFAKTIVVGFLGLVSVAIAFVGFAQLVVPIIQGVDRILVLFISLIIAAIVFALARAVYKGWAC